MEVRLREGRTVVGHFVAGFVDAEEVQVADALELAAGHAVDSVLRKFRGLELSRIAVVEVVDDELASVPVADPVCTDPVLVPCLSSRHGEENTYQGHRPRSGR